jgi:hypothetical protein
MEQQEGIPKTWTIQTNIQKTSLTRK